MQAETGKWDIFLQDYEKYSIIDGENSNGERPEHL